VAFRLVTLNVNGIRSAAGKGFMDWARGADADCMGVQEVKAQAADVAGRLDRIGPANGRGGGLAGHFHFAQKKGYSGVGLFLKRAPSAVITGIGSREFDAEGRWVEARYDTARRKLSLISCYFPSGSSGEHRQAAKFRFLKRLYPHLVRLKAEREFILMGDINIAHQPIDLKNWRGNQKNSGFLPEERAWLDKLFAQAGLVDVFRTLDPRPEQYTWWSNRGQAWAKNVGWRIDYQLATPALAATAKRASIYLDQRFSDHAPLTIDYGFKL
jgi:exodeoxyribonuclease III